jgi:hypothetical protein
MDLDRLNYLREIAESKDDACDEADEQAMIEAEFGLWEDIWQDYHLPCLKAAE